jgi:hypothetical protein
MARQGILTQNIRADSGKADAWRDYQQAWAEVGAVHSSVLTGGKVVVSPIGKALLGGELSYPQFLSVQAVGYQYPNGAKRTLQPGVKGALGSQLRGLQTLIDVQLQAGMKLKPFLLCLQVMRQLAAIGKGAYLTRDELRRFLAYEKTNDRANELARGVAEYRSRGGAPPPIGSSRNFDDIIAFLGKTSLFRESGLSSPAVALRDATPDGLALADRVISAELQTAAFFVFNSGSIDESRKWFVHYGKAQRADALLDPLNLSKQVAEEDLMDDADSATDSGPPPELSEIGAPKQASGAAHGPRERSSPEGTAMLREKARKGHRELVALVEGLVRTAGGVPRENPKTVDIFTELGGRRYYFEMKTANRVNLLGQVRKGLSQLYEYSYRYEKGRPPAEVILCIVLNMKPSSPRWLADYLVSDRKVNICWRVNGGFAYPDGCAGALGPILSPAA